MKAFFYLLLFSSAVMAEQQTANTTTSDLEVLIQRAENLRNTLPMSDATVVEEDTHQDSTAEPSEPVKKKCSY